MDESPFSKLPTELRTWVYEMVLCHDHAFTFNVRQIRLDSNGPGLRLDTNQGKIARSCLAITQTCSEIRDETYVMFFAVNRFFFSPTIPSISGWTGSSNARYRSSLHVLREWLDLLPTAAAKAIKLTILFGAANGVTAAKAAIWRRQTRKLERTILHPVMDLANIFASFFVGHYYDDDLIEILACHATHAHRDEISSCLYPWFDIPTADLDAARSEVERTLRAQSERIKRYARMYPCCVGRAASELQDNLQVDAETAWIVVGGPSTIKES